MAATTRCAVDRCSNPDRARSRPQLRIVTRLASINEERVNDVSERDFFWSQARKRLGKLRRLSPRDIWQIEVMLGNRIPKPVPGSGEITRCKPSALPIRGPHQPLQRVL